MGYACLLGQPQHIYMGATAIRANFNGSYYTAILLSIDDIELTYQYYLPRVQPSAWQTAPHTCRRYHRRFIVFQQRSSSELSQQLLSIWSYWR